MFNLWKLFAATRDFRLWPLSRKDIWWVANIRIVWLMSHRDIWWVANIRIVWPMSHRDIRWVANIRTVWPMSHRDIWWVGIIQNHLPTCTNRPYGTTDTTDTDFSTHQWSLCDW